MKKFIIVLFITLLAIAAFAIPRSGTLSRISYDDIKSTVFSYKPESESEGRLELLGIVYKIDLEKAAVLSGKIGQLLSYNIRCLPEGITGAVKIFALTITDIWDRLSPDSLPPHIHCTGVLL